MVLIYIIVWSTGRRTFRMGRGIGPLGLLALPAAYGEWHEVRGRYGLALIGLRQVRQRILTDMSSALCPSRTVKLCTLFQLPPLNRQCTKWGRAVGGIRQLEAGCPAGNAIANSKRCWWSER